MDPDKRAFMAVGIKVRERLRIAGKDVEP